MPVPYTLQTLHHAHTQAHCAYMYTHTHVCIHTQVHSHHVHTQPCVPSLVYTCIYSYIPVPVYMIPYAYSHLVYLHPVFISTPHAYTFTCRGVLMCSTYILPCIHMSTPSYVLHMHTPCAHAYPVARCREGPAAQGSSRLSPAGRPAAGDSGRHQRGLSVSGDPPAVGSEPPSGLPATPESRGQGQSYPSCLQTVGPPFLLSQNLFQKGA